MAETNIVFLSAAMTEQSSEQSAGRLTRLPPPEDESNKRGSVCDRMNAEGNDDL